jgi:hypothetical protein
MCRGFKLGDGEGPQLSFCSAARGKAGKRASPVRRLAAARSCAQPASLARQPNAGLRTCAQRQTDGSARSSLRDESRASAVFLPTHLPFDADRVLHLDLGTPAA